MNYTRKLISVKAGAEILDLSPKTIYNRGAGTEGLTRVPSGRRGVKLILQEVEALRDRQIKVGQKRNFTGHAETA